MPTDDRDEQFERALRHQLRNAPPDWACPDAETLSAYHDGKLEQKEFDRWREHIAQCTRCQRSLALVLGTGDELEKPWNDELVRTLAEKPSPLQPEPLLLEAAVPIPSSGLEEEAAAFEVTSGRRPSVISWRWALPLGVLAASVIVWVGFREIKKSPSQLGPTQVAERRLVEPLASKPAGELNTKRAAPEETAEKSVPPASAKGQGIAPRPPAVGATKEEVLTNRGVASAGKEDQAKIAEETRRPVPSSEVHAELDLKSAGSDRAYRAAERAPAAVRSGTGQAFAPVAPPRQAARQAQASNQPMTAPGPASSAAETVNVAPAAAFGKKEVAHRAGTGGDFASLLELSLSDPRYVVSAEGNRAWRLGDRGEIRSITDGGRTWETQTSGVQNDLTVGSAVSDSVCWVAGKSGTVLLTRDGGKRWIVIVSPIDGDIGGIHGVDARQASLRDVSKRQSFLTSDGGRTWVPSANP